MNAANIVAYTILIVLIIKVWLIERKDIHCPTFSSTEEECKNHGGMSFSYTKPNPGDNCQELLNKIYKAAGAEQAAVKWRKAFVFSSIIMFLLYPLIVTPGSLPDWKQMVLSILIGYVVILATYMYYSYHVYGVAERWIRESVDILRTRCIIKS